MNVAYTIPNYAGAQTKEHLLMDERAFQVLYDRTARPLWAYLIRVSARKDVADDVLQETYCRFLARRPEAMDEQATRKYLFRIATNLLNDRWRRGEDAEQPEIPEAGFARDFDAHLDVQRTMQQLKPRERQLLWLAYVEEMNHAEIAAITGLSTLSIRMLLFRARRKAAGLLRPTIMVKG
jgi:RNA polymerase sigma-70 factor (ECF subfamily)